MPIPMRTKTEQASVEAWNRLRNKMVIYADKLGLTRQALQQWTVVPVQHIAVMAKITGLTPAELRPDLFELFQAETAKPKSTKGERERSRRLTKARLNAEERELEWHEVAKKHARCEQSPDHNPHGWRKARREAEREGKEVYT